MSESLIKKYIDLGVKREKIYICNHPAIANWSYTKKDVIYDQLEVVGNELTGKYIRLVPLMCYSDIDVNMINNSDGIIITEYEPNFRFGFVPTQTKKIYLAGPDVFRENPFEYFEKIKKLCSDYGFIGLSPFDNESGFDGELFSKPHSTHIFKGNVGIVKEKCDIIIANLTPFRGVCVDDGTAWELGCGYTNGKLLYGYTPYLNMTLPQLTESYNVNFDIFNMNFDIYPSVESFGQNNVNLMIQESIELSGGKILSSFEDCLIDLKEKFKII